MHSLKVFHIVFAVIFLASFLVGMITIMEYRTVEVAIIMPNVFLMAFGTLGLLIQFIFINLHLMSLHKENK